MNDSYPTSFEVSVDQETAALFVPRPHVVLLGAGASLAALPGGDANGAPLPLLRDLVSKLELLEEFPESMRELAATDFEAAYSQLALNPNRSTTVIDARIRAYFERLKLPDTPTLYDALTLSLRQKDAIFTFNWDPFLMQARLRLAVLGVSELPQLYFLHGNVTAGYCAADETS